MVGEVGTKVEGEEGIALEGKGPGRREKGDLIP